MNKNETSRYLASLTTQLISSYEEKNSRLAIKAGLTGSEFKCLSLFGSAKVMNNTEIANRMNLSPARLTRIIDGIVKKGFMTKDYDTKDWRSVSIKLSRKGKLFVQKSDKLNEGLYFKILSEIKVTQHQSLVFAMEKISSSSKEWLEKVK